MKLSFKFNPSFKKVLVLLPVLVLSLLAQAQREGPPRSGRDTPNPTASDQQVVEPDTFGVFYFFADEPWRETPFSDSLLENFQQYDPTLQQKIDFAHLGIMGSAHRDIFYRPMLRKGFDIGIHHFDLYKTSAKKLPFYRLERAYTQLAYTKGAVQSDEYIKAIFSRNFANGLNFSLKYDRISQLGVQNQYPNQSTRNTSLAAGMWYQGPNKRYNGFLAFAGNTIEQGDNGGLIKEPLQGEEFETTASAEIFIQNGKTRNNHREISYTHFYQLRKNNPSDSIKRRAYTAKHQFNYEKSTYKFYHDLFTADSTFYDFFPGLLTDLRGSRYYITHQKFENTFSLLTLKSEENDKNAAKKEKNRLQIQLTHILNNIEFEPSDTTISNLMVSGEWRLNPKKWDLLLYGHLGLWDNAGDYGIGRNIYSKRQNPKQP